MGESSRQALDAFPNQSHTPMPWSLVQGPHVGVLLSALDRRDPFGAVLGEDLELGLQLTVDQAEVVDSAHSKEPKLWETRAVTSHQSAALRTEVVRHLVTALDRAVLIQRVQGLLAAVETNVVASHGEAGSKHSSRDLVAVRAVAREGVVKTRFGQRLQGSRQLCQLEMRLGARTRKGEAYKDELDRTTIASASSLFVVGPTIVGQASNGEVGFRAVGRTFGSRVMSHLVESEYGLM